MRVFQTGMHVIQTLEIGSPTSVRSESHDAIAMRALTQPALKPKLRPA